MRLSREMEDAVRLARQLEVTLSGDAGALAHRLRRTLEDLGSAAKKLERERDRYKRESED